MKQSQKTPRREIEKAKKLFKDYKKGLINMSEFPMWEEVRKELKLTAEEEEGIRIESEIIEATIEARKNKKMTQEELSRKSGLTQSVIARIESGTHSPTINTLMRYLLPMGYTLKVVPIKTLKDK